MSTSAIGIDFGTTNSSIARAHASGEVELCRFPSMGGITDAFRSLLYLEQVRERGAVKLKSWAGPEGIEQYLAAETKGRLVQSLKSFLSSRSLQSTDVFGRRLRLEELIVRMLRDLREKAEAQFGPRRFVRWSRDARYASLEQKRTMTILMPRNELREAYRLAGYESVEFELEPVAAAHYYESALDHDELILIGDFGGGTSDFSLLHVGPTIRKRGRSPGDLLGNSGLGLAGDAFDARIVRNLVSPALGKGSGAQSLNKVLPAVPNWVYAKLERWHHLSFLRTHAVMNMLNTSRVQALEPEKIEALIHLIKEDLGYHLHRSVQKLKCDLSENMMGMFRFSDGFIELEAAVERRSFEEWIGEDLGHIEVCVDSLDSAGVEAEDVDRVFLTGGSSFVPAVRRIFETRFGGARIRAGNEFTSVARGLALKALDSQMA